MLIDDTLFGRIDLIEKSIARLKEYEPPEGYYLAFSGGKDSIVLYELAKISSVKFDAHYNITTVDPPELVQFIKNYYPDVERNRPEKSMWQLIVNKRMPPTRIVRYCCEILKERGGSGRFVLTGIRKAESNKRKKRKMIEYCLSDKSKRFLHPIIDWSDNDIWEFINTHNLRYCSLYDEGYSRIGCIMCPMGGSKLMLKDAKRYPKIKNAYIKSFQRMIEKRLNDGLGSTFKTGLDVYNWWVHSSRLKKDKLQLNIFD